MGIDLESHSPDGVAVVESAQGNRVKSVGILPVEAAQLLVR